MAEELPKSFGPYTLQSLVARGGMAEIYRATMPGMGGFERTVAIKKILPHLAENDEFITMLIDEARIIVSINHANIAQVYDLGKIDDSYYIAMEYIHGIDLSHVIKRLAKQGEHLPFDHVAHIGGCICAGLHAAHSKTDEHGNPLNIVHRDVSPHNVLISYAGDVKIIDFGVAKASVKETHTKMGVIKGKLLYMAPEQAMAKNLDGRADLFAVGLCLYKMLTHQLPFSGENEFQIYNNILSKDIVPPRHLNPGVPEELNQIVMTLLQRDPNKRYQDGYAAKQDLDRFLHRVSPGYTVNRLSRYVEDHFSEPARREADAPPASNPAAPSSPPPETDNATAAPPRPSDSLIQTPSDAAALRTETSDEATGQFPIAEPARPPRRRLPPVVYGIIAVSLIIVGLVLYTLLVGTPAPNTAAQEQAPTPAPAPSQITVDLDTSPQGALVRVGQKVIGESPVKFKLPRADAPVVVTLQKEGFEPRELGLVPDAPINRVLALSPALPADPLDDQDASNDTEPSQDTADEDATTGKAPAETDEPPSQAETTPTPGSELPKVGAARPTSQTTPTTEPTAEPPSTPSDDPAEAVNEDNGTREIQIESAARSQSAREDSPPDQDEPEEDTFIPVLDDFDEPDAPKPTQDETKDSEQGPGLIDPFG